MKTLISSLILFGVGLAAVAYNGWVLTMMWAWFVVPTFGLPVLSVVPAVGLALIVSMLTYQIPVAPDGIEPLDRMIRSFIISLLASTLFLISGWAWSQWMPVVAA